MKHSGFDFEVQTEQEHKSAKQSKESGPDSTFEITQHEDSAFDGSAAEYSQYEGERNSGRYTSNFRRFAKFGGVTLFLAMGLFAANQAAETFPSLMKTNLRALNFKTHLALKDYPAMHSKYIEFAGAPLDIESEAQGNVQSLKDRPKSSQTRNNLVPRKTLVANKLDAEEVAFVVQMGGFPKEAAETMTCIAFAESSHRHGAKNKNRNGTHDTGLFQINDVWLQTCKVRRADLLDPITNAKCAYEIWKVSGFSAWEGYKRNRKKCDNFKVEEQAVASN